MILQHDKSFSNQLLKALEVYQTPLCRTVQSRSSLGDPTISHGLYSVYDNERFIDCSLSQKNNPLGHSHPLLLSDRDLHKQVYPFHISSCSKGKEAEEGHFTSGGPNFIHQLESKKQSIVVNDFHGHNFEITQEDTGNEHPDSNKIARLIDYYISLKIFSKTGPFIEYSKYLKKQLDPQKIKVEGLHLIIIDKELSQQRLLDYGVISDLDKERTLYFPIALTPKIIIEATKRINEALCSS